ncbi:hypothetical protein TCAL_11743 [Tigriopus californicus]|uniref:Uncharacterized protein n=1 Tax=Tigriopus californicus TaxID=6832 RepID=A0A553PRK7_TIGCA|nr:uncharacterized protein LOC131891476 [Tigriopus californicus]TRY80318.1 hypothetical protein TCAL_11743 [Tigriopus californicus]
MSPNSSPVKAQKPEVVLNRWCQQLSSPFQKPWTQTNILYHYVPLFGAIDFHLLALNVLNPKLLRNLGRSIGLNVDCTNLFLAGSIAGGTLHLYNRRHMGGLTLSHRAMYSTYLGSLSVLGSVLLWAIGSRVVPGNPLFRTLLAVGSAWSMLKVKLSFLDHLDAGAKQR